MNGYTSRQLAFADARMAVAKLCAEDRSPAYKAAVMEALRALDSAAQPDHPATPTPAAPGDDVLWAVAAAKSGTQKVPPYGFPVIVLPRPTDVGALYRELSKTVRVSREPISASAVQCGIDPRDRERLLYSARVLRAAADLNRDAPLGNLWSEVVMAVSAIKRVLDISDEQSISLGLTSAPMLPPGADSAQAWLTRGWGESAIAWEVCASIHLKFAKGRDAVFTTRQADFVRHGADARAKYHAIVGPHEDPADG